MTLLCLLSVWYNSSNDVACFPAIVHGSWRSSQICHQLWMREKRARSFMKSFQFNMTRVRTQIWTIAHSCEKIESAKLPKLTLDIVVACFWKQSWSSINVFLLSFVFNHSIMMYVSLAFTSLIYFYASCQSFLVSFFEIAILCYCDLFRR